MPPTASFDKGAAIEEWADTKFFRPIGLRIARASFPTAITPDQITLISLLTGLVAGRLCFYNDVRLNAIGAVLFVVSDIFDSADGQLARMRGSSTRFGKILDGLSDGLRFANLYVQLILRALVAGTTWWIAVPLGVAAGLAHARQSAAVDTIRQLYMYIGEHGKGEFNLPEDFSDAPAPNAWRRFQVWFYRSYLDGNARMLPESVTLVRTLRGTNSLGSVSDEWSRLQRPVVRQCAWIAQNIRFVLIALFIVPGYPLVFFAVTLVPLSLILVMIRLMHERNAVSLLTAAGRLTEANA